MDAERAVVAPVTAIDDPPYVRDVADVAASFATDTASGLSAADAATRLAQSGPNAITSEKPPSVWAIAVGQFRNPMNIMLVAVVVVSFAIDEVATAIMVALLILLNVVLGSRQELKARASVTALSSLQVPQAKAVRDGVLALVPAVDLVPGDLVQVEAGDIVPADGRIVHSATLETQEAALTGESAPVGKNAAVLPDAAVGLGDRSNMLFQNTSVTRGTASMIVTATGMQTQMGQIATMLTSVTRSRSPLQKELDSLTKVLGIIAWSAVAFIFVVGLARGMDAQELFLLGTAMAISAIPTGLPAFVSGLLSLGAKQLADAKAIVKNLTDVETLGATSAINTDKTGTLTMNQMMVSVVYADGAWFTVDGEGYRKTGAIRSAAGVAVPDFTNLALGMVLDSDATVADDGAVVGDPTEAALVVLAAKLNVDAEETRRAFPRLAEVPFDSEYKFMATFHRTTLGGRERIVQLVKGGPDVVLARCARAGGPLRDTHVPIDDARPDLDAANSRMGGQGLRVLAFAARFVEDDELDAMQSDPMSLTHDLDFVGMVGIIDPLRVEAKAAVQTALGAGIDVRMITGDHAVTAGAIGAELGLGAGAMSGSELQGLSDDELARRLPALHVFGRVSPEDKLRLARVMQEQGLIVAMTGDAVNDAAALKQADIGVAMGSGSEVTKQAGRMILTDDNFGTLVNAVEIGRRVYDKIVSYVRYQMTQLLALVILFIAATIFDVNEGVALTPLMVIYLLIFVTVGRCRRHRPRPGDPDVMHRPPRDPKVPITNRTAVILWVVYGTVFAAAAFVPLVAGPDEPSTTHATASLTMTFVVMGLGTVFNALTNRRDPASGLTPPILTAVGVAIVPVVLIFLATQLPSLQTGMLTTPLSGTAMAGGDRSGARAPVRHRGGQVDPAPASPRRCNPRHRAGRRPGPRGQELIAWRRRVPKMKEKEYQHELRRLHGELVATPGVGQGIREPRCACCSKGATPRARAGRSRRSPNASSPRVFRVVALPAPTEREKSQMYIQRYVPHLPAGGEVVIFDRSWYNRAGVERVMGFCTDEQAERFLEQAPAVEKAMIDSGIRLIKYWLEVSADEQTRRLESRIDDPRKVWKLSDMDLASYTRWDDYSRARDEMFAATDTAWAPWYVAHTDDKKRARLNVITHLLSQIPYEAPKRKKIALPERVVHDAVATTTAEPRFIPTPF